MTGDLDPAFAPALTAGLSTATNLSSGGRSPEPVQGTLLGRAAKPAGPLTTDLPVARVYVDISPPHLDRLFEYAVPAALAAAAVPGVRVKVRFAGKEVTGWLVERVAVAEHLGALQPLRKVVSTEPVLTAPILQLARTVAQRYVGTVVDVLRLAVPARQARVEKEDWADAADLASAPPPSPVTTAWQDYRGGEAFCRHLRAGGDPRAVWSALPGDADNRPAVAIAQAVAAAVLSGRGAVVVAPDTREVDQILGALVDVGLAVWHPRQGGQVVRLEANLGPAPRYRNFLALRRGAANVVVGTRAAAFAPVQEPGLFVCWDDDDPLHAEPRAPYPHTREVLALRAGLQNAGLLIGGYSRSVQAQALVARQWAQPLVAERGQVRQRVARIQLLTSAELAAQGADAGARIPTRAQQTLRRHLQDGPVLVSVPRTGYVPVVACQDCRRPATCKSCAGPVTLESSAVVRCQWCGQLDGSWRCHHCQSRRLRAVQIGSQRTAEEIGRALPGAVVRLSSADGPAGVLSTVGAEPAVVVATPGAEPVAAGGFQAAVILDAFTGTLVGDGQALRRWMAVAAQVRSAGEVLVVGDGPPRASQALVRWDAQWLAQLDLDEREELGLPPHTRVVAVTGARQAIEVLVRQVEANAAVTVLGPVTYGDEVRVLLRVPLRQAAALVTAVGAAVRTNSAKRDFGPVRVQVDPVDLLD